MGKVQLIMPKMGESIIEATILQWVKKVGDRIELDETVLEISTDKVDSEVPSPFEGILTEILFKENDVVPIGQAVAIIEVEGEAEIPRAIKEEPSPIEMPASAAQVTPIEAPPRPEEIKKTEAKPMVVSNAASVGFLSPLVKNIIRQEGISHQELVHIQGSGKEGRITKNDILKLVSSRAEVGYQIPSTQPSEVLTGAPLMDPSPITNAPKDIDFGDNVEIVEMSRMRKLIAKHMVDSRQTSAHVTSFMEVDVTPIVEWRNSIKDQFQSKYKEKITFTPIFIQAVARGITDYPMINSSVIGDKILIKKDINIGMATAMESGNLIVPVIRKADFLNLVGLTKQVNDLAHRARSNKLKPEEIQDGTFTLTNVGTFGSMMGTPIINQPQVAILAVGAIRKKPVVIESPQGDVIGIRHMMIMSLSYDHRIIDGSLGSQFLKRVADILEAFTPEEF